MSEIPAKLLSPQQTAIMQHLVNGLTVKEVASVMNLATATVRKHVNKARRKLNAKTHTHAIALAVASRSVVVDLEPIEIGKG